MTIAQIPAVTTDAILGALDGGAWTGGGFDLTASQTLPVSVPSGALAGFIVNKSTETHLILLLGDNSVLILPSRESLYIPYPQTISVANPAASVQSFNFAWYVV